MDYYLGVNILTEVYGYMGWQDLRAYKNVPYDVWRRWFEYFCLNEAFKKTAMAYWGGMMKFIRYKTAFLGMVEYVVKHWPPNMYWEMAKKDRNIMMELVMVKKYLDLGLLKHYIDDEEVVLIAISGNPLMMKHITIKFVENKEFILKLVQRNGLAIMCIPHKFKKDKDVLKVAMKQLGLKYGGYREIVLMALKSGMLIDLEELENDLWKDVEIREAWWSLKSKINAPRFFWASDRETVLKAVKNGCSYFGIPSKFQVDEEIILEAARRGYGVGSNDTVGSRMKTERDFCLNVVKCNGENLEFAGSFNKDKEIAKAAVQNCGAAIKSVDWTLFGDQEWVLDILHTDRTFWMYVDTNLKHDNNFLRAAMKVMCKKKI